MGVRPVEMAGLARLERWASRWMDPAAELISRAYEGHVDGEINDQYHSAAGAKRFLQNIVQYPGCGQFSGRSSWVALDARDRVVGLSLASRVSRESGHITQLCVEKALHGSGLGSELLRRSLRSLGEEGAEQVSLTVTAANRRAIRLYERFGFRATYHFEALVWEALG
jgi:ribosomal protein S18 acetylase RimI-like enzyme